MAAYVISDVEPLDPAALAQYRESAQATIARYGGRYLARGGTVEAVEGGWSPRLVVIVEFPSLERARQWYSSPEYAEALRLRPRALDRRLIFVDGVPPA
jgi:uncharacterized protein (DUF1330 family)